MQTTSELKTEILDDQLFNADKSNLDNRLRELVSIDDVIGLWNDEIIQ
ncbi:hypothetical protein [Virgibacillus profundi]|nr:hypothetical protein [Virgibacillus profundi]